jgi:hypothetical protein
MKKVILTASLLTILILSCEKQNTEPCNCGLIVSDNANDYSVDIRNSCSGNTKRFYLTQGDWMNAFVGDNYCITNSGQW